MTSRRSRKLLVALTVVLGLVPTMMVLAADAGAATPAVHTTTTTAVPDPATCSHLLAEVHTAGSHYQRTHRSYVHLAERAKTLSGSMAERLKQDARRYLKYAHVWSQRMVHSSKHVCQADHKQAIDYVNKIHIQAMRDSRHAHL